MECALLPQQIIFDTFKKKQKQNTNFPEICRDENWLNWRLMECPFNKNILSSNYMIFNKLSRRMVKNSLK